MELMRGLAFVALLFAGSAVGAELRQAETCANGNTHQAGFCPAVLSGASCSATGATTGSCSATSDEADGTRYVCATSSVTALTGAEIEACSGGAAVNGSSAAETGSNSVSLSGLTTDAAHYGQIVNESPEGWYSNRLVSSGFTPTASDISMALEVEYADSNGDVQTVYVQDGVTSISGTAPFMVQFDASGTRAPSAWAAATQSTWNSEEDFYAFTQIGYRINYGEGLGTTWDYPEGTSYSRDEDMGPPIFHRVFTTTGTHSVRLKAKDELGNEGTISMTVVVSAPPAATHIPVSDGAWPTWADGAHYTLDAGGDYSGFGTLAMNDVHNVVISKTGSGADPIIGTFNPNTPNTSTSTARSSNVRLLNIDVGEVSISGTGFDHVAVVGGRCRKVRQDPGQTYFYDADGTASTYASIRTPRGLYFWDCGEMNNSTGAGTQYAWIGLGRAFHLRNVDVHTTEFAYHSIRWQSAAYSSIVNTRVYKDVASASSFSYISFMGDDGAIAPDLNDMSANWRSDDRIGNDSGSRYSRPCWRTFMYRSQFDASGGQITDTIANSGAANSISPGAYADTCGWEDNVGYDGSIASTHAINLGGRAQFRVNNRLSLGAGATIGGSDNNQQASFPVGLTQSYYHPASGNPRPVPSAF